MIKIITGHTGENHVTSDDEAAYNLGLLGKDCVLDIGNKLKATALTANSVKIEDGEFVMQGKHGRIMPSTYETVTIENGQSGYGRHDIICVKYEKDSDGVESMSLVTIKGTAKSISESSGATSSSGMIPALKKSSVFLDPTINNGSMRNGDNTVYMPLYRITIVNLTIASINRLFVIAPFEFVEDNGWRCKYYPDNTFTAIFTYFFDSVPVGLTGQSPVYEVGLPGLHNVSILYHTVSATYTDMWSWGTSYITDKLYWVVTSRDARTAETCGVRFCARIEGTWT